MTTTEAENLAAAEPGVTSFDATVTAVDDRSVRLDRTYFYAEGGGQPPDRGTLGGVDVIDVQTRNGETIHTLADDPGFVVGDSVTGQIDEAFRTYTTRAHTASHVVFGVGRTLFEDPEYGGFDIGEDSVRVDFATTDDVGSVNELTFQRRANEVVWESRDVDWDEMDAAEARADDEIVFNLGADAADASTVRIVEIEGWDVAACGGTHVGNTIEIGPIQVLDVSNPGADLLRVEYTVGPGAIDRWVEERRNATRAASTLDTSVADLPGRAEGLLAETESLAAQVDDLGERLLEARLDAGGGDLEQVDGAAWYVGTIPVVGPNTVADHLGDRADLPGDVVVLAGRDGTTFVVVGTTGERDASAVVDTITTEFGGGGGGGPTVAQGGGIDVAPEAVVEFVRDR
jgi:alanyl-tRNA synthetase